MNAEESVRAYYDALRSGDPLAPFFARAESTVKFGIGDRLTGYEEIEAGLSEQTETTGEWRVGSDRLVVTERDEYAWFSDDVSLSWTDTGSGVRYEFDSRWSGTLERRAETASGGDLGTPWRFVGMHVSAPEET